jgi:hypothetical protein
MFLKKKKAVTSCVLSNKRSDNYKMLAEEMLQKFQNLGCNTNLKINFLFSQFTD